MTPELLDAVRHVKLHFPGIDHVFFDVDARWLYCVGFAAVSFDGHEIDIGVLEAAQDSLCSFPCAFYVGEHE